MMKCSRAKHARHAQVEWVAWRDVLIERRRNLEGLVPVRKERSCLHSCTRQCRTQANGRSMRTMTGIFRPLFILLMLCFLLFMGTGAWGCRKGLEQYKDSRAWKAWSSLLQ